MKFQDAYSIPDTFQVQVLERSSEGVAASTDDELLAIPLCERVEGLLLQETGCEAQALCIRQEKILCNALHALSRNRISRCPQSRRSVGHCCHNCPTFGSVNEGFVVKDRSVQLLADSVGSDEIQIPAAAVPLATKL